MKPYRWAFGTLFVFCAASGAFAEGPVKAGLWDIEWHTNWAMFLVRNDRSSMEHRESVSAQALKHPLYKRACLAQTDHPDAVVLRYDGCKLETKVSKDVVNRDGLCGGRKDGISEMHVGIITKSPEAVFIQMKASLDPQAGYPLLESYDMRWISADCGDLPAGATRPIRRERRGRSGVTNS